MCEEFPNALPRLRGKCEYSLEENVKDQIDIINADRECVFKDLED